MKRMLLFALILAAIGTNVFARGGGQENRGIHIEIVSKGFLHQFWQNVALGSNRAAEELGITINFVGPESEAMIDRQSEMFETALARNPQAIAFAPLDAVAQVSLVARARAMGIPVVTFDATVASDDPVSFVATDSLAAGAVAADRMNDALGGRNGRVAVIASDQTNTTQILRRDGFINRVNERYSNIEIVSVQYGVDPLEATEVVKAVMIANPDLAGYYACNEGTAIGLINAIRELNMQGRIIGIGFDSGRTQIDAIRDGTLNGAIQQNPVRIGYEAVMLAYRAFRGETIPRIVDTGIVWADRNNIDSEEVRAVLYE